MTPSITIDGQGVAFETGQSVLDVARSAGIYIPTLCSHPDLPPFSQTNRARKVFRGGAAVDDTGTPESESACGLCQVEVEGWDAAVRACDTPAAAGMVVMTVSPRLVDVRRDRLELILNHHPHACLTCAQRRGCSREPCSTNVPLEERCCPLLGQCELEKVSHHVGIKESLSRYVPAQLPPEPEAPLFARDYELCIGCTRCVRACNDLEGVGALKFVYHQGRVVVGMIAETPAASGCRFCGVCIEVCPTGAMTDEDLVAGDRRAALVPCQARCPTALDVPRYIRHIAREEFAEAAELIRASVPLPATLGFVCFHPCEEVCRRARLNEPVAICALKRFAMESEPDAGAVSTAPSTGKRVAVVGAGPCGLSAAWFLRRQGHEVTVFERLDRPGGMLAVGIPRYRLPLDVLERDVDAISATGVSFVFSWDVPKGGVNALTEQGFDAIFVATGAHLGRAIGLDDDHLQGVDFLRAVALGAPRERIDAVRDRRVLVIGGGNVAIDVTRTAVRLGARAVEMVCLETADAMPAFTREVEDALEEGIRIYSGWGPVRVLRDEGGVTGLEVRRCTRVFDAAHRFDPAFDDEDRQTLACDVIIQAAGQTPDLGAFASGDRTTFDKVHGRRFVRRVGKSEALAGGDVTGLTTSVIEAIEAGREAAVEIGSALGVREQGDTADAREGGLSALNDKFHDEHGLGCIEGFTELRRIEPDRLSAVKRRRSFSVFERTFTREQAVAEARRCLACHLRLSIESAVSPPGAWIPFVAERIGEVPENEGVFQILDDRKNVLVIKGTDNLRRDLLTRLESNERGAFFLWEEDKMFSKRESELIQQHLQECGTMPGAGDDDLDDLF